MHGRKVLPGGAPFPAACAHVCLHALRSDFAGHVLAGITLLTEQYGKKLRLAPLCRTGFNLVNQDVSSQSQAQSCLPAHPRICALPTKLHACRS